jgi:AcrR family transcriptional regulator
MDTPLTLARLLADELARIDQLDQRILRTAITQFTRVGIRRATTDSIARHALVNRTTLHRRIGTKDQLVRAALTYECHRQLAHIATQLNPTQPPREQTAHGFALTVTTLRTHPLLRRALATDPDDTLTSLTLATTDLLTTATRLIATHIHTTTRSQPTHTDPNTAAAVIVRLAHSLVLTPAAPPLLNTYPELLTFARTYITQLTTPPPGRRLKNSVN